MTPEFLQGWDEWLQRAVASSQEQLGGTWLNIYLTSPIWRFVLSPGVVDSQPWAGIVMPSVDKVGRYFPLTLASPMPGLNSISEMLVLGKPWFDQLEEVALKGLMDGVDVDHIDALLQKISPPEHTGVQAVGKRMEFSRPVALQMAKPEQNPLNSFPFLLDSFLQQRLPSYSLWWTSGSEHVLPSVLMSGYLPAPAHFAAMLDGQWQQWNWNSPFGVLPTLMEPEEPSAAPQQDQSYQLEE